MPDDGFAQQPAIDIPLDLVNEQVLIVAALADQKVCDELVVRVPPDLFKDQQHAAGWTAIVEARRRALVPTPDLVQQLSGGRCGAAYLSELAAQRPAGAAMPNLAHHLAALRWDHVRVEAVRGPLGELISALRDVRSQPARVRALAVKLASSLDVATDRSYMRDPVQLARAIGGQVGAVQHVYPYGMSGLDAFEDGKPRLIPGAAPGMVTIVTGTSGSAKSSFVARMVLGLARQRRRVLYGAFEMGAEQTIMLLAMMSLGLSRLAMTTGALADEEKKLLEQRAEQIGTWVRFFTLPYDHAPAKRGSANDWALDTVQRYVADSACDVAVFDLWERMIPDGDAGPERRALFRQQAIAKDTGTHHILVAQQKSKEIEQRADKRPTRSTILGSSAWVDIADTILGVHRPALWKAVEDDVIQIDVLKQRYYKWPLSVQFRWDGDRCTLTEGKTIAYDTPSNDRAQAQDRLGGMLGSSQTNGRGRRA